MLCCIPHILPCVAILHMAFINCSHKQLLLLSEGELIFINSAETVTVTSVCTYWLIVLMLWCWVQEWFELLHVWDAPQASSCSCSLLSLHFIPMWHRVKGHLDNSVSASIIKPFARSWWVKRWCGHVGGRKRALFTGAVKSTIFT